MAEEGAHCPALMLHRLGESQCRTYQPSNASGSGLCKTVTGSLSRWPARCWVSVRGKAVGNAFTASRLQAAALIAPAQRPGGRGAAGGGKGRVHCLYPIFPPTPKRQKPLKERNLLNKPFCLEFFLRGHTGAREGEGLWELDVGTVQ